MFKFFLGKIKDWSKTADSQCETADQPASSAANAAPGPLRQRQLEPGLESAGARSTRPESHAGRGK